MHIVLYKPDIPQNTAAIIRLGACLNLNIHLIEPCGFNLNDSRFKEWLWIMLACVRLFDTMTSRRSKKYRKSRIVLMTTKAKKLYHKFKFKNDMLLFGKESAGVPKEIHQMLKNKIKIPMNKKTRSLNVAIVLRW